MTLVNTTLFLLTQSFIFVYNVRQDYWPSLWAHIKFLNLEAAIWSLLITCFDSLPP